MGQKVRPTGFRVGIMEDWRSRWYASKKEFSELLVEDFKIRKFTNEYVKKKYGSAGIPKIEIERTRDAVKVIVFSARPGIIIGKRGAEVERLQEELQKFTGRRIEIKIEEVTRPEIDAQLISEDIAEQLQKRSSFRRTMKRSLEQTMDGGAAASRFSSPAASVVRKCREPKRETSDRFHSVRSEPRVDYGFSEAKTAARAHRNQGLGQSR